MSAQLNTVSGTIYEDFIVKMMHIKFSEMTASVIMKCIVVITGIICVSLVIIIEKLSGILQVSCIVTKTENTFLHFSSYLFDLLDDS